MCVCVRSLLCSFVYRLLCVCIPPQEPEHLDPGQIDQILGCFVMGLAAGKPVEVQRVSATAMVAALPFASANFEDDKKEQRDVIMGAICNGTQVPDIDVRLAAFDCIILVASLYYSKLQSYMGALFSVRIIL